MRIFYQHPEDAEYVLSSIRQCITVYGYASIYDLLEYSGVSTPNILYDDYCWFNLSNADVKKTTSGCILELPDLADILYSDKFIENLSKELTKAKSPVFHEISYEDIMKATPNNKKWNSEKHSQKPFIMSIDDHDIIPSVMSEEVFRPRRIRNYSEESSSPRRPKRGGKHPCSSTVNHPNHYQSETGLEVIDVIDAFTDGLDGVEAFDTGNIIKYICRWKKKNGIEDLEKAKWYLENLIKEVKEKENEDAK
jgi:hypothetical protein